MLEHLTPEQIQRAHDSLAGYVEVTSRIVLDPWQANHLCPRLERLRYERGQRILFHGPPQFGKTIIVSQRAPSWLIGHRPPLMVREAAYNETHATGMTGINLELMQTPEYEAIFPDPGCRVPTMAAKGDWSTAARRGFLDGQPSMRALGLGSGFTGLGADLLIIDDPYKNQQEAYSETIRENIWRWWMSVARVRLPEDANVVVMFHRWHLDDLAGRLMNTGEWEVITFPALADGDPNDPTGRHIGESLSPRYAVSFLEKLRDEDQVTFAALYQGKPVPDGGNIVKSYWWRYWYPAGMPEPEPIRVTLANGEVKTCPQVPLPAKFDEIIQSWDLGFVGSDTADFAAGGIAGRLGANLFIVDERHQRCDLPDAEDLIKGLSAAYPGGYTKLVEYKALGPRVIARLQGQIAGFFPVKPDGDKKARLQAVLPRIRSGNVYLPHPSLYPWVNEYRGELETFPVAAHDDRVDWTSQLLAYCEGQDWSYLQDADAVPVATYGNTAVQRAPEPDEDEENAFEETFLRMMGRDK